MLRKLCQLGRKIRMHNCIHRIWDIQIDIEGYKIIIDKTYEGNGWTINLDVKKKTSKLLKDLMSSRKKIDE